MSTLGASCWITHFHELDLGRPQRFIGCVQPYVYFMANKPYGTIYVGVTGNLVQRISVHKDAIVAGFTRRYGVHRLVYYEPHDLITDAIQRERNIKHWSRKWKIELIESMNPMWDDLYLQIIG